MDLQSPASRASQQRCLRPEAWRSRRATARAARNGCAASKTRVTTCQAQTAIGFESPCGQLDRKIAEPNRRRRGHCSSRAGLLSRPGTAWHRCLRDCSGEFIRACLAGEASVHLPARVVPLLLRGVSRGLLCALAGMTRSTYGRFGGLPKPAVRAGTSCALPTPQTAPTNHPACPLLQKFFRCAGQIAAPCGARYPSWGGGAPKKAGGKNEKYINTQLAAAVLELKEP